MAKLLLLPKESDALSNCLMILFANNQPEYKLQKLCGIKTHYTEIHPPDHDLLRLKHLSSWASVPLFERWVAAIIVAHPEHATTFFTYVQDKLDSDVVSFASREYVCHAMICGMLHGIETLTLISEPDLCGFDRECPIRFLPFFLYAAYLNDLPDSLEKLPSQISTSLTSFIWSYRDKKLLSKLADELNKKKQQVLEAREIKIGPGTESFLKNFRRKWFERIDDDAQMTMLRRHDRGE